MMLLQPDPGRPLERGSLAALLLLLVAPLGIALVNPGAAFSLLFHDSWLYHGYFVDLPGHLRSFGQLYYSSRLSMTLPGWLAYKTLPPMTANYFLHLAVYLLGVVSLYSILRLTVNARAGLLAALLMGGHYFYQLAATSDYCDGYAIGYFLLAVSLVTRAAHSDRWRAWLFLAGMAGGALFIVNLMLGLLVVPLAIHHVLVNRAGRRHPLDAGGFWLGMGGLVLFAILSLVSKLAGGPLWFLASSFSFAQSFPQHDNPFKRSLLEWLPLAGWLVLPTAVALGGIVFLARRREGSTPLARWYQVQLLFVIAALIGMESTAKFALLQLWLYAGAFLVPVTFLALAGQWGTWLETISPRAFAGLAAVATLAPVAVAALPTRPELVPGVSVLALAALVAIVLPRLRAGLAAGTLAVTVLVAAEAGLRQGFRMSDSLPRSVSEGLRLERAAAFEGHQQQVFESIHLAMREIRRIDPCYAACFWFDIDEPFGLLFDNIACMHCWGHRMVNTKFPELQPEWAPLRPDMRLLLLSADPGVVARLRRAVQPLGLQIQELREREVGRGPFGFGIHLVQTTAGPSADRASLKTEEAHE
jgi:hypothetical protein